jgi:16S rRNA (guanine(966)-N(2))-methyltransferase RsmD
MRIIKGSLQRRLIHTPSNLPVRPTTDLAKESLFNILDNRIDFRNITALDLFAGTGNITYELFSRGCLQVTAVESNSRCVQFIRETANKLNMDKILVIKADVFRFLANSRQVYDLIFADPPYDTDQYKELGEILCSRNMLSPEGWLIIEHPKSANYSTFPGFVEMRRYGKVHFSFLQPQKKPVD